MAPAENAATPTHPESRLRLRLRPRHVHLHRLADDSSGWLIYALCLFSPWAFGTTEDWSTRVMNAGGYLLAALWAVKLYLRHIRGLPAARWTVRRSDHATGRRWDVVLTRVLFGSTLALLGFTLVSAVNARATYDPASFSFIYHETIDGLPSSLDSTSTWFAFWQYLGLAGFFWALRDWLLGKTEGEHRATLGRYGAATIDPRTRPNTDVSPRITAPPLPARLRGLLWLLSVNGALLAIEGIVQRLEGSGRLLFLVRPVVNPGAETQFGPWAYRANAAAYFNLLWPVCLGFWWTLQRAARSGRASHHLLLVCAAVMAACPTISTSRGGAVISLALALLAAVFFGFAHILFSVPRDWTFARWATTLILIVLFLSGGLGLGYRLGWDALAPRMEEFEVGLEQREQMFDLARPMARDYPWFGTGPGTFGWVFQLYRGASDAYWPAQLHNDWLETRITFGTLGSVLIAGALVLILARWFLPGGIHGGRRLVIMMWLSLAGAMAHARWDFPFQIHSIVLLFVIWCGALVCLSRRP
jgi:O-antigen ligase